MLESLPASEVFPDTAELDALNQLLDKWLILTGTVDADIARYPVWHHITELVEDLNPRAPDSGTEGSNHSSANSKTPSMPHLAVLTFNTPSSTVTHSSRTRHTGSTRTTTTSNQPRPPVAPAPEEYHPT